MYDSGVPYPIRSSENLSEREKDRDNEAVELGTRDGASTIFFPGGSSGGGGWWAS